MPLDPQLINGIRLPEIAPYGAAAARTMTLRNMHLQGQQEQQTQEMNRLKLDETKRAVQGNQELSRLLATNTKDGKTDYDAVGTGLAAAGHGDRALALEKERRAERKAELENQKMAIANAKEQHGVMASMLNAIESAPPEYRNSLHARARQIFIGRNWIKPEEMSEQYDPAQNQAHIAEGIEVAKQIELRQKQIEIEAKLADNKPKTFKEWLTNASQLLSGVQSQDQWTGALQSLKAAGASDQVLAQFSPMFSPAAAAQAGTLGMTPNERADNATQAKNADTAAKNAASNVTEAELAWKVANGTPEEKVAAEAALKRLDKSRRDSRPVVNVSGGGSGAGSNAQIIADQIMSGNQPPDLKGLYKEGVAVRAALGKKDYDLTTAQRDWQAIQRHMSAMNGPQQLRLRQAVDFTYDSVDIIEDLFNEWKTVAKPTGFKILNSATIMAAKNFPGRAGEIAQALESQIADLTSELGTVYKGGNASTDHSLQLAAENLKVHWNDQQFTRQLGNIRKNLQIRRNSIRNSMPAGVSENSPYAPKPEAATPAAAAPKATHRFNPKTGKIEVIQ